MTRKPAIIIVIVLGVLVLVLLLFFLFNREKSYAWFETYNATSEQPYGMLFMRRLLQESTPGTFKIRDQKNLTQLLDQAEFKNETSYVFIGEALFLNYADRQTLLNFIHEGNNAFIASKEIPEIVSDFYDTECGVDFGISENLEVTPVMNFYHPSFHDKYGYKYSYRLLDEDVSYNWRTFDSTLFCDSTRTLTPLGYLDADEVNFLRIRYGKGHLFLHTNPVVFTNYFMIQKQKKDYASAVFSHIDGKNVIWEEYGKVRLMNDEQDANSSPLYYIMAQPSLQYAWWLIVASAILYVLFAAKRIQRVIPVLEAKSNTSLEFVKMVASLHFQNKNHMDMARKKMKYFYYFIRSKYGIQGHPFTEDMALRLSEKSKVPLQEVQAVFKFNKLIEEGSNGVIDEIRLSNFYGVIENFYKKCK